VRSPSPEGSARLQETRAALQVFPFHAALKFALAARGVPVGEDVRAPLRPLSDAEKARLHRSLADLGVG
jgi:dihydrodipicolinate synthase/N-acetylneuraminate lyase